MNDDNDPTKLIEKIEKLLREHNSITKLRRALSLSSEASRTPASERRDELMRDARTLLRQACCKSATLRQMPDRFRSRARKTLRLNKHSESLVTRDASRRREVEALIGR
jgi:hypothetical protein